LTPAVLEALSASAGVDFATALLFDRFQNASRHSDFIRQINELRDAAVTPAPLADTNVVIVPGALYVERPDLGGDGRVVREVAKQFGYQTDLLPLVSFGAVTRNARLICEWLRAHSQERVILVSLSKGSADLKVALASPDAEELFANVVAWVNVCGPLDGTRMANWILNQRLWKWYFRAKCRWQRRDFQLISDLSHGPDMLLADPVRAPSRSQMVNLVGFPLRRHMTSPLSRFCHRTLSAWGPNDGTSLLSNLQEWPGHIYPVWGADHYFRPETMAQSLISAVLRYVAMCSKPSAVHFAG